VRPFAIDAIVIRQTITQAVNKIPVTFISVSSNKTHTS